MKVMKMRQIKDSFKSNGFNYQLIKREGKIAMYSQSKKEADNGEEDVWGYEVHKVRVLPPRNTKIKQRNGSYRPLIQPKREELAGNEDFGLYAWTCDDLEHAEQVFKEKVILNG